MLTNLYPCNNEVVPNLWAVTPNNVICGNRYL